MSSSNRKPYLTASGLDQSLLNSSLDNLSNQLELIVEITAPDGFIIRASNRNKYVGEHFYEALTNFPEITRTIGDWLGQGIVFSELSFELSNADGRYNKYLAGGASFGGWIGRLVVVKIGLRDVESSYVQIFRGRVTEEGGFSRSVRSITVRAREEIEKINKSFPNTVFNEDDHPKASEDIWGKIIPVIYGDFTQNVTPGGASVPAYVINGGDIIVNDEQLNILIDIPTSKMIASYHRLSDNVQVELHTNGTLPTGLNNNSKYYVRIIPGNPNEFYLASTSGGAPITLSGTQTGTHYVQKHSNENLSYLKLKIADNALSFLDTTNIFLKRNDRFIKVPSVTVKNVNADKNYFELEQDKNTFVDPISGEHWKFDRSDEFFVRCKGKNIGANWENTVEIAKDILLTYSTVVSGDFDSTWNTYLTKSSPANGAVSSWKCRAWIGEQQNAMEYAISLLEQVRIELFFPRTGKISLKALHWDEFVSNPSFRISNWDVERDSFKPMLDDRNNFNRARAIYGFLPDIGENGFTTNYFKNNAAITQAGKEITKVVIYPNLWRSQDVAVQLQETLKLASGYREVVEMTLTSRAILNDLADWVVLDVQIGSSEYVSVPCQIRGISYSPDGLKLPVKLWAFTMLPFGSWNPSYAGIVGGESATIVQE